MQVKHFLESEGPTCDHFDLRIISQNAQHLVSLTHFKKIPHIYTPWKHKKIKGFWRFQGV